MARPSLPQPPRRYDLRSAPVPGRGLRRRPRSARIRDGALDAAASSGRQRGSSSISRCRSDGGLLDLVIADLLSDSYLGEVVVVLGEHRVGGSGAVWFRRRVAAVSRPRRCGWSPDGPSPRSALGASKCSSPRRMSRRCASSTGPAFSTRGFSGPIGTRAASDSTPSFSHGFRPTRPSADGVDVWLYLACQWPSEVSPHPAALASRGARSQPPLDRITPLE